VSTVTKLACSLAILAAVASTPARAQSDQYGGGQMGQFAPMMDQMGPLMEQAAPLMQAVMSKIGKKRMRQIMEMAGPMMAMMASGGGGDFYGAGGMPGSYGGGGVSGMEGMMGMMGGGGTGRVARKRAR
jgi:hypothetical protein